MTIAAAVELLHAFALLHDDVMDRSETRRGNIAAHRSLTLLHQREHWHGDADWFGTSAAILAGDLTFAWADQLFDCTPLPHASIDRARVTFNTLRAEVMAGQYLDLRLAARPDRRRGRRPSRRIAEIRPLHALPDRWRWAGASPADPVSPGVARALAAYGDAVGIAFQLRDDVLGLFGDPGRRARTVTAISAKASARCSSCGRCGWPDRPPAAFSRPPSATRRSRPVTRNGVARSWRRAVPSRPSRRCSARSTTPRSAALAPVPEPARLALEELAALAIRREH